LRGEIPDAPFVIIPGAVITTHAIGRIRRPAPPIGSLLIDVSLSGGSILLTGQPDVAFVAALGFFVAASILLLPSRQALAVIGYSWAWFPPIALWAPLAPAGPVGGTPDALTWVGAAVGLSVLAALLFFAVKSVSAGRAKQSSAVEVERQAVRLKDQFVSMVSHELRTPLTSIAGFVETLQADWPNLSQDEVDEFLRIVQSETQHLSALVEDVLVIPRIEAGALSLKPESFELRPVVAHVLSVLTQDAESIGELQIPGGVSVFADPTRLQQVLRNITENAIKYGGDQFLIEGRLAGTHYEIIVSDNGPGVAEAHRELIFEHFEQLAGDVPTSTGIGLGLPIARRLARAMGGDLWFEERFPTGSRFCFSVPIDGPGQAPTAQPTEEAA